MSKGLASCNDQSYSRYGNKVFFKRHWLEGLENLNVHENLKNIVIQTADYIENRVG